MIFDSDLFGAQQAKLVPTQPIADLSVDGAGFAGFATGLDLTATRPGLMAVPDPSPVIQQPRGPEVAWIAATATMESQLVDQAPRNVLRKLVAEAADMGLRVKTGVEPEFFLLNPECTAGSDPYDPAVKPCQDQQAMMRRYDIIAEVCDCMLALGRAACQNNYEDAVGQFEMNWKYDGALQTEDKAQSKKSEAVFGIKFALKQ